MFLSHNSLGQPRQDRDLMRKLNYKSFQKILMLRFIHYFHFPTETVKSANFETKNNPKTYCKRA